MKQTLTVLLDTNNSVQSLYFIEIIIIVRYQGKYLKLSNSGSGSVDSGPQPTAGPVPPGPGGPPRHPPGSPGPLPGDPHLARGGVAAQARYQGLAERQEDKRMLSSHAGEIFLLFRINGLILPFREGVNVEKNVLIITILLNRP